MKNSPSRVLAVILGGGKGTRLSPLTHKRSKPAVPLAGKYRLVDIPISNCLNSKMNKIYVLTQFNSASLNRHIKDSYTFDLFSKGFVDILAAEQTYENVNWYQGTADAVRQTFQHFERIDYDYMLILSGDQLYQMDYRDMLDEHVASNADISIATIPVNATDATGFGIMKTDQEHNITSFIEKPESQLLPEWVSDTGQEMQQQDRHYLASMGIYLFSKQTLKDLLSENDGTDFGKNIIPSAINRYNVKSFQFNGYWTDIGTIKSFYEANLDLVSNIPNFNLYHHEYHIYTHARMLPPAKVLGTTLNNVLISEGAIVFAELLENTIVGIRTRIGKGSVMKNAYIMGSDTYETLEEIEHNRTHEIPPMGVGENCNIQNAILDKNVRIGNNVSIVGGNHLENTETDQYIITDGIIVVKKDAILPNGFTVN